MQASRIRLGQTISPLVRHSRIPYRKALRWWPPSCDEECQQAAVVVFMTQRAFVRCCAYAGSDLEHEVGGWLIGKRRRDKRSGEEFIIIDTILPAQHTQQGIAFLTFTQDSQVALHTLLQESYPDKELVGWYHTHPRMGIFLSEMDTWLHNHFFPEQWQVALVIEPCSARGGFFIRQEDGSLDARRYFGFFELNNGKRRSVVHWRNLVPQSESPRSGGKQE